VKRRGVLAHLQAREKHALSQARREAH
jgi:hypothetical protein